MYFYFWTDDVNKKKGETVLYVPVECQKFSPEDANKDKKLLFRMESKPAELCMCLCVGGGTLLFPFVSVGSVSNSQSFPLWVFVGNRKNQSNLFIVFWPCSLSTHCLSFLISPYNSVLSFLFLVVTFCLSSRLYLYVPLVSFSCTYLFFLFLAIMIHWTNQVKEVLNEQKVKMNTRDSRGPLQEIAFWKSHSDKLSHISWQLQKPGILHIKNILQLSKSIYVAGFSDVAKKLQVQEVCLKSKIIS